jgi:CHAT domain-containing protein/Tfp pilus assembly protein PilF
VLIIESLAPDGLAAQAGLQIGDQLLSRKAATLSMSSSLYTAQNAPMLIVESVASASSAERAGLLPGDRLLRYDDQPLSSPFTLQALEENTFGKPSVILVWMRAGQPLEIEVSTGTLGIEVRPEMDETLLTLHEQARAAQQSGEQSEAGRLWRAAAERAEESEAKVWHRYQSGAAYEQANDWPLAQEVYTEAWGQAKDLSDNAARIQALTALGRCGDRQSDYSFAEQQHGQAQELAERSGLSGWQALSLNNLGNVACNRGDLDVAQDFYLRSLKIRERLAPGSLDVATSLYNLGSVAWHRGELDAAQDFFLRSLKIQERLAPDSLNVAMSLSNLGNVAWNRGDLDAAQDFHLRSLKIIEHLAPDSLYVAMSLNNLGTVAAYRGDLDAAQDFFLHSLKIRERFAPDSLNVAMSLNNLGTVARNRGDLDAAQDFHLRSLKIQERLAPDSLDTADSHFKLGQASQAQGKYEKAQEFYRKAIGIVENQRSRIQSSAGRSLLLAQHLDKYLGLIQSCLSVDDPTEAFATLERCRARSFAEMLAERQIDFTQDAPPQLLQRQQEIDQQRKRTYDQLANLSANDNEPIQQLHTQLRDLNRQQETLTAELRQTSPRYADLQYPQPLDLPGVQASLDAGTLALVYQTDKEQTYLFAITSEQCRLFHLPIGRDALTGQVRTFRKVLDVRRLENTLQEAVEQGNALYKTLIAPAQALLKKAKRQLLCPEGPLLVLPFACLVSKTGRKPRYLGEAMPLHQTVSLTVYAQVRREKQQRERRRTEEISDHTQEIGQESTLSLSERIRAGVDDLLQTGKRILALGDPLYPLAAGAAYSRGGEPLSPDGAEGGSDQAQDDAGLAQEWRSLHSRGMRLVALPHTRKEVESIGRIFGELAQLRLGAEATKTAAITGCRNAAVVHFACHGWLDNLFPLSSALALSKPASDAQTSTEDNGLLQAWEVFEQIRLNAELVVLSACETGLGQEVRGEGLLGLTRAFQYAGAQSVLVSLWEINDRSTSHFMSAFYEALREGNSKDEALQASILALRQSPEWRHPYFWAAFALQGDWQ